MSLVLQGRGVFGFLVGGLGVLGLRALGSSGSGGGKFAAFCLPSSSSPTPVPLPNYSPNSVRGLALAAAVADLQNKDAIELASSCVSFSGDDIYLPYLPEDFLLVLTLL